MLFCCCTGASTENLLLSGVSYALFTLTFTFGVVETYAVSGKDACIDLGGVLGGVGGITCSFSVEYMVAEASSSRRLYLIARVQRCGNNLGKLLLILVGLFGSLLHVHPRTTLAPPTRKVPQLAARVFNT